MHEKNEYLDSLLVMNILESLCTQLAYTNVHIDEKNKVAILLKVLPKNYDYIVIDGSQGEGTHCIIERCHEFILRIDHGAIDSNKEAGFCNSVYFFAHITSILCMSSYIYLQCHIFVKR